MSARNFIFILLLVFSISGCISGERALNVIKGEEKYVRVAGDSMAPAIKSGSIVFYRAEPYENLKVGDVIIFREPIRGGMIMRRIVTANDDGSLMVKADARPEQMTVVKDMYVGKIII